MHFNEEKKNCASCFPIKDMQTASVKQKLYIFLITSSFLLLFNSIRLKGLLSIVEHPRRCSTLKVLCKYLVSLFILCAMYWKIKRITAVDNLSKCIKYQFNFLVLWQFRHWRATRWFMLILSVFVKVDFFFGM